MLVLLSLWPFLLWQLRWAGPLDDLSLLSRLAHDLLVLLNEAGPLQGLGPVSWATGQRLLDVARPLVERIALMH